MKLLPRLVQQLGFLFALLVYCALAAAQFSLVPTYHSIGVYWKPADITINGHRARVTYWKDGQPPQEGHELWFDDRSGDHPEVTDGKMGTFPDENELQFRGSLVELEHGTVYNVKVELLNANGTLFTPAVFQQGTVETWSDEARTVPANFVIPLPTTPVTRLVIRHANVAAPSAAPSGTELIVTVPSNPSTPDTNKPWKGPYTLIVPGSATTTADVDRTGFEGQGTPNSEPSEWYADQFPQSCVVIEKGVKRVIIRGLKLRNCTRSGVIFHYTQPNTTPFNSDIVIEDNLVTNWGWSGTDEVDLPDSDAGVMCAYNSAKLHEKPARIVIQRNRIEDPRYNSTHWYQVAAVAHPKGPTGIDFRQCGGNHVIRHNEIIGTVAGKPVTFTASSPNISWPGHGLADDTPIIFSNSGGQLPSPLVAGTRYFVVGANLQAGTFQVSGQRKGSAISMSSAGTGTHIATRKRYLMDGMGGGENFSWNQGWLSGDSDVYQNVVTHAYDDGIEAEGANRNMRVWGNYFDNVFMPIANVNVGLGPIYVWRNVSHSSAGYMQMTAEGPYNPYVYASVPDTESPRAFVKGGGRSNEPNGGRAYYLHNTILQPPAAYCGGSLFTCGSRLVITDDGNGRVLTNVHSYNNIWHTPTNSSGGNKQTNVVQSDCTTSNCKWVQDLHNATLAPGATGPIGRPTYDASSGQADHYPDNGLPSPQNWQGDFRLAANTTGTGIAEPLKNFNIGTGADIGAHQRGTPPMKFGRAAAGAPTAVLNTNPSPANGTGSLNVTFTSSSTPGSAPSFASITLDFGDGSPVVNWSDHPAPKTHTYGVGTFSATLTVTTSAGSDTDSKPISVAPVGCQPPTASFTATPESGFAPLAVAFNASASSAVSPATITSYNITYGDSTSGTGVTQNHTYQSAGTYVAVLKVTDSNNCESAPVSRTINATTPPGGGTQTVTMRNDLNGYAGTTDAHLWSGQPNTNRDLVFSIRTENDGPACTWCDSGVIRFAVFQSEGGLVPNGATIISATLRMYQFSGPPAMMKASRLLKNWHEQQVTWNSAATGTAWSVAGANGSGSDYLATPDGEGQSPDAEALNCDGPPADPNQCWMSIDVTSGVRAFGSGSANHGWKIAQVSSPVAGNFKNFNTSENTFFPQYRPELVVVYSTTPPTTATLMEGQGGYAGTTDAQLWSGQPNTNRDLQMSIRTESDASCTWCDSGVIRFAIFQSEGGTVPNNAVITSATLSLYQFGGPDAVIKASRLLKSWHEQQVTWNVAATGTAWTVAGANGSGTDYRATADGQAQSPNADALNCDGPPADPSVCWLNIDVTSGVQAFATGTANFGWKLAQVSSSVPGNYKNFNTSENGGFPNFRPKLTVQYVVP